MNLIKKLKEIKISIDNWIASRVFNRKYIRSGKCKGCGRCCQSIYVRHSSNIIKTQEEFDNLRINHYFYSYLKVIDKNETGLVFECTKLDPETKKCTIHKNRPLLCRQYPVEEVFMMGGEISENCGYKFTPIKSFEEVFKKAKLKVYNLND